MRLIALTVIITLCSFAQTVTGPRTYTGPQNMPSSGTLPSTCTVGAVFFKTGVTAGQNWYGCTATDTWTLQTGSGSSGTSAVQTNVSFSATPTFTVLTSTVMVFNVAALTTNISSITFTTSAATTGQTIQFIFLQDGTGGRTVAYPTHIVGACAPATPANAQTIVTAVWNGTDALASSCVVNVPVACSIEEFSPAANGSTDDTAVFVSANSACPGGISLQPNKQYAIKSSITFTSPLTAESSPSGGSLLISNSAATVWNGTITAPVRQLFGISGGGTVVIGPNTQIRPAGWFGAVPGASSATNTTGINNALLATNGGTVTLTAGTYNVNCASGGVVISLSKTQLVGNEVRSTYLNCVDTSGDVITITPATGSGVPCGAANENTGWWTTVRNMSITRTTPAVSGAGIRAVRSCYILIDNVAFIDQFNNVYLDASGGTHITNTWADYSSSSGSVRTGVNLDSTNGAVNSIYLYKNIMTCNGNNMIGTYVHGPIIADVFGDHLETALCDYGVKVLSTANSGTYSYVNGDINFAASIFDQTQVAGALIDTVYGGGTPSVIFTGGFFASETASAVGIDIENSQGVQVNGAQIRIRAASGICVKIAGANSGKNQVNGGTCQVTPVGVQIASSNNAVTGMVFSSLTSVASTTNISLLSGATYNAITGGTMSGYSANGIVFASGADNNKYCNVAIDPTNITTPVTDGGTSNVACGSGGGSSSLASVNSPADLWLANEGTGNTFKDFSGLANDMAAGGTVTWSAGPSTCFVCAHYDGSFDTISANHTRFNPATATAWSGSMWISTDVLLNDSQIAISQLSGGNAGWFLFLNEHDSGMGRADRWILGLQTAAGATAAVGIFGTAAAATLYHLAWSNDGTGTVGGMKFYINGVQSALFDTLQDDLSGAIQPGGSVYLGGWSFGTANRFAGYISGTSLYNRVLTDAEVLALYTIGPLTTLWVAK